MKGMLGTALRTTKSSSSLFFGKRKRSLQLGDDGSPEEGTSKVRRRSDPLQCPLLAGPR